MSVEPELCSAEPAGIFVGRQFEPCPLEPGHTGLHVFWQQDRAGSERGRNGVRIYEPDGTAVVFLDYEGGITAPEVGAIVAYMNWANDQRRQRQATLDG